MDNSNVLKSMVCCEVGKVMGLCQASLKEIEETRQRQSEKKIMDYMASHNEKADARNKSWLSKFFPLKRLETREETIKEMIRLYEYHYNSEWNYGDGRFSYTSSYAWEEFAEIRRILNSCRMSVDGKIYLSQEGVAIISRDYSE